MFTLVYFLPVHNEQTVLAANVARLRGALAELDVPALGNAHIVPIPTGPRTMAVAEALRTAGFLAPGIRYPTVPRGQERVRLTVSAAHAPEDIDALAETLARVLRVTPPGPGSSPP